MKRSFYLWYEKNKQTVSYLAFRPFWACYGINGAVKRSFYSWYEKNKQKEFFLFNFFEARITP